MSNHENEQVKERLYEDLLEYGYSDDQIIKFNMIEDLFFNDRSISEILKSTTPDNPAYNLQKKRVNGI